jgi:CheY-like chemotaxis protein
VLVAMTGYGLPEDRKRSLAAGFDFHLVKPVDAGVLAEILTRRPT